MPEIDDKSVNGHSWTIGFINFGWVIDSTKMLRNLSTS